MLHYWRILTRVHMAKITRVLLFVCSFVNYGLSQLLIQDLENQHYLKLHILSLLLVRDMVKLRCFIICNLYQSIGSFQITHICLKQKLWRCIMFRVYYHLCHLGFNELSKTFQLEGGAVKQSFQRFWGSDITKCWYPD